MSYVSNIACTLLIDKHSFPTSKIRAFDTELVVIAEKLDVSLSEVGVVWNEVDGSKLDVNKLTLALVSLGMLRDMICVRACYLLGIWRLKR